MKWIRRNKKRLLFGFLGLFLLLAGGLYGCLRYFVNQQFADRPNTLRFEGDLHPVPFQWTAEEFEGDYIEPHSGIRIPITVPGVATKLYMQFDTGSPYTFLRSGCLDSLKERGVEFELFEESEGYFVRNFEINAGGNKIVLEPGRVLGRDIAIDWETKDAINIIGSFGADFIDQKICAIDFPAEQIQFYEQRPKKFDALGSFKAFAFKGRRIMLPAKINGVEMELFYDSGCSSFGLLTSKYHFDRYTDSNAKTISFNANRFGDPIPIHHRTSDLAATFGEVELPLNRVSYVDMYSGLQSMLGGFVDGGFLGNKALTDSTLILDTKADEFLVVPRSITGKVATNQ